MTTCIKWELYSKTLFSFSDYSYVICVMTGFTIGFECIYVCVEEEGVSSKLPLPVANTDITFKFKILKLILESYVSSLPKYGKAQQQN